MSNNLLEQIKTIKTISFDIIIMISKWVFFIILFSIPFFFYSIQHPHKVSIAVGQKDGAYNVYAQEYKKELAKYDIDLEIIPSEGSSQTQNWIDENKVDFAFVQGGLEKKDIGILALANVALEPIWVLSRKESDISKFEDLKDKKINICNPKSGTFPVAKKMLTNLLDMKSNQLYHTQANTAFNQLLKGEIDVMFYIIARSSKSLEKKINHKNIDILSFEDSANSIKKYFIRNDMNQSLNSYFTTITLEKGSISFQKNIPSEKKILLAKRTILVTKNASNRMVRLFLQIAHKVHSKEGLFYEENHFLNIKGLKYKQHPASKRYFEEGEHRYEKNKVGWNYWLAQSAKYIEDIILIIIIPLGFIGFWVEVVYPIIKIVTRKKISKWYKQINVLDTKMDNLNLEKSKQNKLELEKILTEMQDTDDIDPVHLESFYSLQQQTKNMIEDYEKRIEGLENKG